MIPQSWNKVAHATFLRDEYDGQVFFYIDYMKPHHIHETIIDGDEIYLRCNQTQWFKVNKNDVKCADWSSGGTTHTLDIDPLSFIMAFEAGRAL